MADPTQRVQKVTFNRRFWGDYLLEGILVLVTLIIGWLIWLAFTAPRSQTPAKRLLGVYMLDLQTGQPITAGRVWVRELLVKTLLVGAINAITSGIAGLVNALWVFFDKNRQALHDKVVGTVVVYAPNGLPESVPAPYELGGGRRPGVGPGGTVKDAAEELRELARLRQEGILTDEEYEAKRREIAEKL
jgi:uncharacterized RDD family membrane protein YckC